MIWYSIVIWSKIVGSGWWFGGFTSNGVSCAKLPGLDLLPVFCIISIIQSYNIILVWYKTTHMLIKYLTYWTFWIRFHKSCHICNITLCHIVYSVWVYIVLTWFVFSALKKCVAPGSTPSSRKTIQSDASFWSSLRSNMLELCSTSVSINMKGRWKHYKSVFTKPRMPAAAGNRDAEGVALACWIYTKYMSKQYDAIQCSTIYDYDMSSTTLLCL